MPPRHEGAAVGAGARGPAAAREVAPVDLRKRLRCLPGVGWAAPATCAVREV